ncbi:MAG: DUF5591 domain-containing protein [Candidatus Aenigmarchaeota archaeon]|nr:DUF5591 domain-containing protein [Candidatus Aenigmarchaeota archaeon]
MSEKTLYLKSGKCTWGKCIFCGWGCQDEPVQTLEELKTWLDQKLEPVDLLKIFNSGSFLDDKQVDPKFREYVIKKCEEFGIPKLTVESRPEFITAKSLKGMKSDKVHVTIAIGLECADDKILKKLNKGFTVDDYLKAAKLLKKNGFGLRSYVLVNAPFTNQDTLRKSVELAREHSESVILLNWFPHGYSAAFNMWIEGKWKPFDKEQFEEATKEFGDIEKDFDNFVFRPRWPKEMEKWINGATEKELLHPYYELWQDFIVRFFKAKRKNVLFVPCAFRKPYNISKLHRSIRKTLFEVPNSRDIHLVVISSPGVIPYEFVDYYPFNRYDWKEWEETPEIKKKYIEVNQKRIENYLNTHKYEKYYCYFKLDSESYIALKQACKKLKIELIDCLSEETYEKIKNEKNPLTFPSALEDLKKNLKT